ncbi:MAG: haloacid dehalogenase type II [Candidatus Eremiobacteraeota bacterium]|nr:haloacid dehalogenase type II [Candidatus Eremiobacteraeota bacterium]
MNSAGAIAFDLFGTLVDFTSLHERFAGHTETPQVFVESWRAKQLQYAFLSTMMVRYQNFDVVTERSFDYTCALYGLSLDRQTRAAAIEAWHYLPAYPDAAETLAALRERGWKLAVLSNGTPEAIRRTLEACGLAPLLDGMLSVDAVRAYKPRPEVYELAVAFFGRPASEISFVSSNAWDALGAGEFGFTVHWCNRSNAPAETLGVKPSRVLRSLKELLAS